MYGQLTKQPMVSVWRNSSNGVWHQCQQRNVIIKPISYDVAMDQPMTISGDQLLTSLMRNINNVWRASAKPSVSHIVANGGCSHG